MMTKFMIATFANLILRVILAMTLSIPFGATGIWLAWPIGWIIATVMSIIFYKSGCWNKA
jgi:Na+-driven multidrug efflux pump